MADKNNEEIYNRINFGLELVINLLAVSEVILGFDLENKNLVLKDIKSNCMARVDLEKLNKSVLKAIDDNK